MLTLKMTVAHHFNWLVLEQSIPAIACYFFSAIIPLSGFSLSFKKDGIIKMHPFLLSATICCSITKRSQAAWVQSCVYADWAFHQIQLTSTVIFRTFTSIILTHEFDWLKYKYRKWWKVNNNGNLYCKLLGSHVVLKFIPKQLNVNGWIQML